MAEIARADLLRVGLEASGAEVRFPFEIDGHLTGALRVAYPLALDVGDLALLPPIAVGAAGFLAQLCLARRVVLDFPATPEMVEGMLPIVEMVYDIRCWRDQLDLMPRPEVERAGGSCEVARYRPGGGKRAVLLWSGGKDSTLSHVLLTRNGFQVHPVHITANTGAETAERRAVAGVARALGVRSQTIDYDFPQFLDIAGRYAGLWDIFPGYNVVPFGRDMLLALLASPIARRAGATYLCMGHEHGSRENYFDYRGKRVARDDVESVAGGESLEAYLRSFISPDLALLPPVAGLSEFRILHELFTGYPEVVPQLSFCYWGTSCGRCSKCLRYYLVGRVLGQEHLLRFQVNPLEGDNCLDLRLSIEHWRAVDEGRSYAGIVVYCLARLVERGDVRPGEMLLERFAAEVYSRLRPEVEAIGRDLMTVHPDPQVPPDFEISAQCASRIDGLLHDTARRLAPPR